MAIEKIMECKFLFFWHTLPRFSTLQLYEYKHANILIGSGQWAKYLYQIQRLCRL
jgi:hypothetical protein